MIYFLCKIALNLTTPTSCKLLLVSIVQENRWGWARRWTACIVHQLFDFLIKHEFEVLKASLGNKAKRRVFFSEINFTSVFHIWRKCMPLCFFTDQNVTLDRENGQLGSVPEIHHFKIKLKRVKIIPKPSWRMPRGLPKYPFKKPWNGIGK